MTKESRESMKTRATNLCNDAETLLYFLSHPTIYQDVNKTHIAYLKGVANALASIVRYEDEMDGSLRG
jgi:hypothetical protein